MLRTPDNESGRREGLVVAMLIAAFTFLVLAVAVSVHQRPIGIEAALDRAFAAPRGTTRFDFFKIVTITGSFAFVAAGAAVLGVECWTHGHDRRLAVACIVGPGLAGIAEIMLKPVVGRPRPATSTLTGESGFGFPSGHAAGSAALAVCAIATAWALLPRGRLRTACVAAATAYAAVIGVSRVVVGAHYPADVLGGWLLGVAVATATLLALRPETLGRRLATSSNGPPPTGQARMSP